MPDVLDPLKTALTDRYAIQHELGSGARGHDDLGFWPESDAPKPITRLSLKLPGDTGIVPLTYGPTAKLSPDGSQIVFMGPSESSSWQLWVRPLDRLQAAPTPGTNAGYNWSLSPDGQMIAFQTGDGLGLGTLRVVSLSGGAPPTLTDSSRFFGGDWGPDGYIYFTNAVWGLSRMLASGGPVETLTKVDSAVPDEMHLWPDALPKGGRSASGSEKSCSQRMALHTPCIRRPTT